MLFLTSTERLLSMASHFQVSREIEATLGSPATACAHGSNAWKYAGDSTGIEHSLAHHLSHGKEKQAYVQQLNSALVITFRNGVNDVGMLRVAAIGVAILGVEGMAVQVLQAADVITFSIFDAIDLVLKPKRLIATLRE